MSHRRPPGPAGGPAAADAGLPGFLCGRRRLAGPAGAGCRNRGDCGGPPVDAGDGTVCPPPGAGAGLLLACGRAAGVQIHRLLHWRQCVHRLGAPGSQLLHLPAAVAAEGGLHPPVSPWPGRRPDALRLLFPHRHLRPHSAPRRLLPSAGGREFPAPRLGGHCRRTVRHLLRHHQKGAAGGLLRHGGGQRLGPAGRPVRPRRLAGDFGLYHAAVL